jgi:hypothetical protein
LLAVRQPEVRNCQCPPRPPALGELFWALSVLEMPVERAPESEVTDRTGIALADTQRQIVRGPQPETFDRGDRSD